MSEWEIDDKAVTMRLRVRGCNPSCATCVHYIGYPGNWCRLHRGPPEVRVSPARYLYCPKFQDFPPCPSIPT